MPLKVLDLFSGAGGAAFGLHQAWPDCDITGVDIVKQPRYPFRHIVADAMTYPLDGFDFIWASPPCQAHTALRTAWNAKKHADLLTPTRARLRMSGSSWVMENVPGAPMRRDLILCGTMFGLGVGNAELRRHRWFEFSYPPLMLRQPCAHGLREVTIGVYGQHGRDRRRGDVQTFFSVADGRVALGIDWMSGDELSQAVPPAYSKYIAEQLTPALRAAA